MVERRTNSAELEASLRIDRDDLDSCLVEQPGLFYQAAEAVATANSRRDALKLELEEAQAELDQQYRRAAMDANEKIREGAIENQIITAPRIKKLQRECLELRTAAENCTALKEAYQQRSFMLRELVAIDMAHFQNLQVERGAIGSRHRVGESVRNRQEQLRRERRAT